MKAYPGRVRKGAGNVMQQGCWQGIQCKQLINKAFSALKLEAPAPKAQLLKATQPIEGNSAH
ncbi:hypothetical protein [Cobetia amphilecti]|uniref:hypothetical protein n=1 Tax=Cobetia amphilecti TaxID=1055104 RepID=UPI0026E2898B|nr:hypothetical protein [Cobetia amphilecti]MDO6815260.1 hypothetical protein [Cobetia amphilecti]